MNSSRPRGGDAARVRLLLIVGIALVAVNLRPALASVGPLVPAMRLSTGLPNAALGLLTTLPLVAFGCVSVFISQIRRRIGTDRAVAIAVLLIGSGTLIRAVPSVPLLYFGTVVLGVGIAMGNVLLPAIVKRDFPRQSGPVTSLYSSMMGIGATLAAGVSVPLAGVLGWRGALGVWVVPAVLALIVWSPRVRLPPLAPAITRGVTLRALGKSPLAWQVALYLGLQSVTFYIILTWLPDLLNSRGLSEAASGWMLALSQATGIAGTALIPIWAGRVPDQRAIVWTLGVAEAVSLLGLLLGGDSLLALWVSILGFVMGGTFGLSLTLLVLRSSDEESTGELSGMAQSAGYLVAALGPIIFGFVHDVTLGWTIPLALLLLVLVGKVSSGLPAGRPGVV